VFRNLIPPSSQVGLLHPQKLAFQIAAKLLQLASWLLLTGYKHLLMPYLILVVLSHNPFLQVPVPQMDVPTVPKYLIANCFG